MGQAKKDLFAVGDYAVYPGVGVGEIVEIETKEIMGFSAVMYCFRSEQEVNGKIKRIDTLVPQAKAASVGLRKIISRSEASEVISILKEKDVKIDTQTWNRRYREYTEKIKTGSIYEIAEVLRDLVLLQGDKELSYGEKEMLKVTRKLLLKELSLAATKKDLESAEVKAIFGLEA